MTNPTHNMPAALADRLEQLADDAQLIGMAVHGHAAVTDAPTIGPLASRAHSLADALRAIARARHGRGRFLFGIPESD